MPSLCFVLMPFGKKRDPAGGPEIDFDRIYEAAIAPAILAAGLEPVRADHEVTGGIIHKPMFERLLLCEFAVADLTTANANVFYELGVRHAACPYTTLPIFATGQRIPFDVQIVRGMSYGLGDGNAFSDAEANDLRERLTTRLRELRDVTHEAAAPDSPLLQLLQGYTTPNLAHLRTDLVEKQLVASASTRRRIADARARQPLAEAVKALAQLEENLGSLRDVETGTIVDLYLSYRAVGAFDAMLGLYDRMPQVLRSAVLVREQRAFALNRKAAKGPLVARAGLRAEAEQVLTELIADNGANAELAAFSVAFTRIGGSSHAASHRGRRLPGWTGDLRIHARILGRLARLLPRHQRRDAPRDRRLGDLARNQRSHSPRRTLRRRAAHLRKDWRLLGLRNAARSGRSRAGLGGCDSAPGTRARLGP